MINWIFDLDHTLYQQEYSRFNYKNLQYSPEINYKLNSLEGKKILFTNGNLYHTLKCIKSMKMERIFHKISCRELTGFKPDINSYIKLYHLTGINLNETCIFFEDTIENLVQSKRFKWVTVLIGNYDDTIKDRYEQIDYVFRNINLALDYFLGIK
jgi:HAD superfamily hydrolase (TIGR01509 family)